MGIENTNGFYCGILYDDGGKPIGTCQSIYDVDTIVDDPIYDNLSFTLSNSLAFTVELDSPFDTSLWKELSDFYSKSKDFDLEWDGVYYEQIRKHKKKRINKKWAKRYGYREVPCRYRMENAHIQQETFNDFSITTGNRPRIIERYRDE